MDLHRSSRDSGNRAVYLYWRRNRAVAMELVAAATVWLAADHLLAGARASGALPHPLWQIRRARVPSLAFPPWHGRTLASHDSRGAGPIPARHARTLWLWASRQRKPGAMNCPWPAANG